MFRSCKLVVILILGIFVCSTSAAFAQNGKALSLNECIKIALKSNSQLRNAVYQVDRSGADVKGSYSSILPRISSSFTSGRFVQGDRTVVGDVLVGFDSTRNQAIFEQQEFTQDGSSRNSHSASITYSQTVFDFGRSWNRIKQAKASFEGSAQNLTAARQSVYATVQQRYFELLKAVNLDREYEQAVERGKQQLSRTQIMYEIGSVALVEVYRSERTLGTDEINYIIQKNVVRIARANLNVTMGRDPEIDINIVEHGGDASVAKWTLDEAIGIADENNPDLRRFEYQMKSAEYGMKIAKGAYLPSLGFSMTYSRSNAQFGRIYSDFNQNFSVSFGTRVDFNLFNGLSDAAQVSRESATYSIAKENWIDTQRNIHLNVKRALINLTAFKEISEINVRNLRAGEEEYRLAQERYRVGAGTQLELTEAQVSLTRARVLLVSAKYNAMIAQAQLESAMGIAGEVE